MRNHITLNVQRIRALLTDPLLHPLPVSPADLHRAVERVETYLKTECFPTFEFDFHLSESLSEDWPIAFNGTPDQVSRLTEVEVESGVYSRLSTFSEEQFVPDSIVAPVTLDPQHLVIVEVQGGIVQRVLTSTNRNIRVIVVDRDDLEDCDSEVWADRIERNLNLDACQDHVLETVADLASEADGVEVSE